MEVFNALNLLLKTSIFPFTLSGDSDWITPILLLALILVTVLFTLYRRKYSLLLSSLYSSKYFKQLSHEGKIFQERIFLLDLLLILLAQSLLCYYFIKLFFPHIYDFYSTPPHFRIYFFSLLFVVANYIFNSCMTLFFTYLYDIKEERSTYFSYKLFNQSITSLMALPIIICVAYTSWYPVLIVFLFFFVVNFLIMGYRLFVLNVKKIQPFHFFIYFCTFEILPYLVILKILVVIENQVL